MDWHFSLLLSLVLMPFVYSWNPIPIPRMSRRSFYEVQANIQQQQQKYQPQKNALSPYLDLIMCPLREQPWSCARQQSGRLLDIWDGELHIQWHKLKDEADRQLNSTLERRGYSDTTTLSKEKPSTILKKIEIGGNYMKEYLAETMDGFLGREYEYLENSKNNFETQNEEDNEDETEAETEAEEYEEGDDDDDEEEEEKDTQHSNEHVNEPTGDLKNTNNIAENSNHFAHDQNDSDAEFVELTEEQDEETADTIGQLKRPGDRNKRRKNKKKKGTQHEIASQAANLLVIQPLEQQLASQHHDDQFVAAEGATQLLKPLKHKKRRRKKGGHGGAASTILLDQQPATDNFGLGLLEGLAELDGVVGGKRKRKYPTKYGRSNGVTRFKKKKKKKALMKLMLLGSFLKSKIELLLKLLGAHLQIKFFAIALIGLLINIARFWIDVKRGGIPQKVVYVEHAHHQHHYDEHGGEDWSETGGGYWKRSLQTDSTENTYDTVTDSYQPRQPQHLQQQSQSQQQYDPQYLAYRNQWQRK